SASAAGHSRHPPLGLAATPFHLSLVLVVGERRTFAGGAHRHQAICPLGDLPIDQTAEAGFVEPAVLERGDERGEGSSEARRGGHGRSPQMFLAALLQSDKRHPGSRKRRAGGMMGCRPPFAAVLDQWSRLN